MAIEDRYFLKFHWDDVDASPLPNSQGIWVAAVRHSLHQIESREAGRLLLSELRSQGRWVWIKPYWVPPNRTNRCNAQVWPVVQTRNGLIVEQKFWAVLAISPERYGSGTSCAERLRRQGGAVAAGHEILFHELVHVLQRSSRPRFGEPNEDGERLHGGLYHQNNFEEFVAVLVTNIYASANSKTAISAKPPLLRAAHYGGHQAMPSELAGSYKFFEMGTQTYSLVRKFCEEHKRFCRALSKVQAPFNPIQAYFDNPEKARNISQSARAKQRDALGETFEVLERTILVRMLGGIGKFEKFMGN